MEYLAFDNDTVILVLLFWCIIGGLVGAIIGKSKGRPEAGFFLGFILGFIGWLVVAVGPDMRHKYRCPECQGVIPHGANKCMHCGSSITWRKKAG